MAFLDLFKKKDGQTPEEEDVPSAGGAVEAERWLTR